MNTKYNLMNIIPALREEFIKNQILINELLTYISNNSKQDFDLYTNYKDGIYTVYINSLKKMTFINNLLDKIFGASKDNKKGETYFGDSNIRVVYDDNWLFVSCDSFKEKVTSIKDSELTKNIPLYIMLDDLKVNINYAGISSSIKSDSFADLCVDYKAKDDIIVFTSAWKETQTDIIEDRLSKELPREIFSDYYKELIEKSDINDIKFEGINGCNILGTDGKYDFRVDGKSLVLSRRKPDYIAK